MKFLFLLFLSIHQISAQISFDTVKDYVTREYASNSNIHIESNNDPRQTQFYMQVKAPLNTDDWISITTPFYDNQGLLIKDKFKIEVIMFVDRPYRDKWISSNLSDIKVFVDSVLLGPLGIPKGVPYSPAWKASIKPEDIPPLLRL